MDECMYSVAHARVRWSVLKVSSRTVLGTVKQFSIAARLVY